MNEEWLNDKFRFQNFQNWYEEQDGTPDTNCYSRRSSVCLTVESKIGKRRLIAKIDPEIGEAEELARDFKREGGIILETEGETYLIEVTSGSFRIRKSCVRKRDC